MTLPRAKAPETIRRMFARIAEAYDLNNALHSLGRDRLWRRRAAEAAVRDAPRSVLDVACGTGKLTAELRRRCAGRVAGVDFCEPMLRIARRRFPRGIEWVQADAMDLPFGEGQFEAGTVAFGLRNLSEPAAGLRELARVLRPGGMLVVLEFARPESAGRLDRTVGRLVRRLMPISAGVVAGGNWSAYRYLDRSVGEFPSAARLVGLVREAGFADVRRRAMDFGMVTLLEARRVGPSSEDVLPL